jgi:hypothetical protein
VCVRVRSLLNASRKTALSNVALTQLRVPDDHDERLRSGACVRVCTLCACACVLSTLCPTQSPPPPPPRPQAAVSSRFEARGDVTVLRNYGALLVDVCKVNVCVHCVCTVFMYAVYTELISPPHPPLQVVPDGVVCFFPSYFYLEQVCVRMCVYVSHSHARTDCRRVE